MKFGPIGLVLGVVLLTMAGFMLVPAAVGWLTPARDWQPFLGSAVSIACIALVMLAFTRGTQLHINPRDAFLITTLVWLAGALAGALPIALHQRTSITNAVFESMSGITTTGSTVFVGLDGLSAAFLLWRSMLQWIGGLGFTLMAIAILPLVGVGGMRLFRSESSDWSDKALPHTRDIAKTVGLIYLLISVACAASYWAAGMSLFDAVNHAMSTVSTGGYSTSDSSMAKFGSPLIHWLAILFMIAGSLPFVAYFHALKDGPGLLLRDEQIVAFLAILVAVIGVGTAILMKDTDFGTAQALTLVAFNVVSVVTTTGFALTDYTLWGPFFIMLFFFLTFVGGCSGSTAGGVKIFRVQIAFKVMGLQIRKLVHPRGIFVAKLNGRILDEDIRAPFVAFIFAYGITVITVALGLAAMGLDLHTALSGAATAVGNVGPGVGSVIGPAGTFASLPDGAKWLLSLAMLLGRLELMTVLVLFSATYWRA